MNGERTERRFKVPYEGETQTTTARQFLARLWPEGTPEQVERLFSTGGVKVDSVTLTRPDRSLAAGSSVTVSLSEAGEETYGLPEAEALLWGDDWLILEKPMGIPGRLTADDPMDPIRFLADLLGADRAGFTPVWDMATTAGGPWVMGRIPERADAIARAICAGEIQTTWVALILRPEKGAGRWESQKLSLDFAVSKTRGPLAQVQLTPRWKQPPEDAARLFYDLMEAMAEVGFCVLGDGLHGGYLVEGGLRLRLGSIVGNQDFAHSWPAPRDWWPQEEVLPLKAEEDEDVEAGHSAPPSQISERREERIFQVGELKVSRKTLDIIKKTGHPWIFRDNQSGSIEDFDPGDPVQLVGPAGKSGRFALVDGTDKIVARMWSQDEESAIFRDEEIEVRLDEAIVARAERFRDLGRTDVFRVVHGEADGLPGLWVDRLGPIFRVITLSVGARGYRDWVYELLARRDPAAMIIEVDHTRDLRRRDELPKARIVHPGARFLAEGDDLIVHEEGLRFRVEPWKGVDVGFFAEQRDNRLRALARAKSGERWLNLFCHTGAFSVALARAGVHSTNVDLSKRYLRWLDENFTLNRLDLSLRENIADDARSFLKRKRRSFDGIIVDPPTAAASDAGFWSIREDYEALLTRCFEVLSPGGSMLVCRNAKNSSTRLEALVRRAAEATGRQLACLEEAPPAEDYPTMKGFAEGDKFEGLWVS